MPTAASPGHHHVRRWLTIIIPACATMLIALYAVWILLGFLAMRDRLGTWHLTVHDDHGTVVGHGLLTIVATRWIMRSTATPPFVRFIPLLSQEIGWITLTDAAPGFMQLWTRGPGYPGCFTMAVYERATDDFNCIVPVSTPGYDWTLLTWRGDGPQPIATFTVFGFHTKTSTLPITATLAR